MTKKYQRGNHTGAAFQNLVDQINEGYERAGIACITRKAVPGKFVQGYPAHTAGAKVTKEQLHALLTPTRSFVPESKAEPDYGGTIAGGRAIFFDTKSTKRDRIDFDNLHSHQIEFLQRMATMDAIAGFLCQFSTYNEIYFLPIKDVLINTTRSIPYTQIKSKFQSAPKGKGLIFYDYLHVIQN